MRWPTLPWVFWALASSLVLHGVAYASLGLAPSAAPAPRVSSELAFEVATSLPEPPPPAPEPEPPPPEPEPEAPPTARPVSVTAPKAAAANPPPAAPPTAAPPAPIDLSGVTLTNAGESSFAMQTGNGQALGIVGPRAVARARPAPVASSQPQSHGPALVPLADLSSRPVPPALDVTLRKFYPEEARRRGVGGKARVRARLDPDGVVRRIRVEGESFSGFGEACRRTLLGSRWSAPRDRAGRPVATEIHYTCRFHVEP